MSAEEMATTATKAFPASFRIRKGDEWWNGRVDWFRRHGNYHVVYENGLTEEFAHEQFNQVLMEDNDDHDNVHDSSSSRRSDNKTTEHM